MKNNLNSYGITVCKLMAQIAEPDKTFNLNIEEKHLNGLYEFANYHRVVSVVYCALKSMGKFDDNALEKFNTDSTKAVFRQIKLNSFVNSYIKMLSDNKIKNMLLKGTNFQQLYPKNVIRISNDADIYVEPQGFDFAVKILVDKGFEITCENDGEVSLVNKSSLFIELHRTITGETEKYDDLFNDMILRAKPVNNTYSYSLTNEDFYAFVIYHLYKHFIAFGCGIRLFYDVYLVNKNMDYDKDKVKLLFERLGLVEFEKKVRKVIDVLFENETSTESIDELINFVFNSGVFGTTITSGAGGIAKNKSYFMGKTKLLKNDYVISKEEMRKRYKYLNKFPFLLPFAHLQRILYGLFHKRDIVKSFVRETKNINKSTVENYNRIMNIAGIKKK